MNKKKVRPIFTVEFKQSAVKLITEQGYTRQEAANNIGVSLSAITCWVRAETQVDSKAGSRLSQFELLDKPALKPLPDKAYVPQNLTGREYRRCRHVDDSHRQ